MHKTHNKKIKHANKSSVMQKPNAKYATLNTDKSKSDIFVLGECSRIANFIFSKYNIQLRAGLNKGRYLTEYLCRDKTYF